MFKIHSHFKSVLAPVAVIGVLLMPVSTLANNNSYQPSPVWQEWYNNFLREHPETGGGNQAVPEFSADAAAGMVALLIGGSFILFGRRKKVA
jgi:tetrahydromethanopterin S-methyltransferase subunit H